MAKRKLDLAVSNNSSYRAFTRNYRQSANVEDRRGENEAHKAAVAASGRTPYDRIDRTNTRINRGGDGGTGSGGKDDPFTGGGDDGATGYDYHAPSSSTRKVDAEEAIRRTHFERN